MMEADDPRALIERLMRAQGDDFASLSRLLGRNAAYVQQYVRRGSPRLLAERDRRRLAEHFGIDEALLGAPPRAPGAAMASVRHYDVLASAGPGALAEEGRVLAEIGLPAKWLRRLASGKLSDLSIITVRGDSMVPTLADGDDILVDRADAGPRLRDGVYVLRDGDSLIVKRVAVDPATRRFAIRGDNPDHPAWDHAPGDVEVIGRVVWMSRRLA